ncbi:hypothetical protein OCH239_22350 [Roseivivax halodurans JCM 10272]|uniref:Uncharacterized protein n=1 Tax=Roseivivax halodurans JCM 10272 TaxID=1449350 RepID=X7E4M8_9RHOB|nr:hypothetical protein [Roseivivax halodurans]ETX10131.1 hypothetical protein OCH239_22350 [Roseivivax halodurans JCM 10272]
MEKMIEGPAYQLHDLWIEENAADETLTENADPWMMMYEAKQFNLKVAKAIGHHSPLFNDNGAQCLAAYMASKLVRGSGSVSELVERVSEVPTVFSEEAKGHTGPLADTLNRAAGLPLGILHSSLESIGVMAALWRPVLMSSGRIQLGGPDDC